jgi:hypothetical protein
LFERKKRKRRRRRSMRKRKSRRRNNATAIENIDENSKDCKETTNDDSICRFSFQKGLETEIKRK